MNISIHPLQIITLATWLSVAGFGSVGLIIHSKTPTLETSASLGSLLLPEDFTLEDVSAPETGDSSTDPDTPAMAETLPAPPELPELAAFEPLPEIPTPVIRQTRPSTGKITPTPSPRKTPRASARKTTASGTSSSAAGSGRSASARLANGRMPAPSYPPEARRRRQAGTVVVEFTVDASGRVISAYAKSPSPWPLLNQEAVRTVRRWKFPPGGVMKLQRPIVFQLR